MEPKRVGTLLFGLGVGLAALSAVVKIQAGNPAVHGGEERDTMRNNRRTMAERLPHTKRNQYKCEVLHMKYGGGASHGCR